MDHFRDEMIRDRIVVGLLNPRLSEKLQMDDKLTLESVVTQVRQSEAVKLQQAVVQGHVDIDAIDRSLTDCNSLEHQNQIKGERFVLDVGKVHLIPDFNAQQKILFVTIAKIKDILKLCAGPKAQ